MSTKTDEKKLRQLEAMYDKARRSFPEVPELTVEELRSLQARENVVLVDVRTPEERAVSMIPGAITAEQYEQDRDRYREAAVVAYCTVGGRSGRYAQGLLGEGRKAYNLKGAILAWTHAGGELAGPDGPTKRVHVHGPRFDLAPDGYEPVW